MLIKSTITPKLISLELLQHKLLPYHFALARGVQPEARGKVLSGPRDFSEITNNIYLIYGELTFRETGR